MAGEADSPEAVTSAAPAAAAPAAAAPAATQGDGGNFFSRAWQGTKDFFSSNPAAPAANTTTTTISAADKATAAATGAATQTTQASQGLSDRIAAVVSREVDKAVNAATVTNNYIETAKSANEKIPKQIFDDIKQAREKFLAEYKETVAKLAKGKAEVEAQGISFNTEEYDRQLKEALKQFNDKVTVDAIKAHRARSPNTKDIAALDAEVKKAHEAINSIIPEEKGMFGKATSAIYDPDKGGVQWGGIIGGLVGLIGGSMLTGGMGGGIMGIISTLLIAVVGVMGGGKIAEMLEERNKKPAETPAVSLVPKQGVKLGIEKEENVQEGATKINFPLIDRELPKLSSHETVTADTLFQPSSTPVDLTNIAKGFNADLRAKDAGR